MKYWLGGQVCVGTVEFAMAQVGEVCVGVVSVAMVHVGETCGKAYVSEDVTGA